MLKGLVESNTEYVHNTHKQMATLSEGAQYKLSQNTPHNNVAKQIHQKVALYILLTGNITNHCCDEHAVLY
jgi:hypothetical protein